jgi:hypothetical protein
MATEEPKKSPAAPAAGSSSTGVDRWAHAADAPIAATTATIVRHVVFMIPPSSYR